MSVVVAGMMQHRHDLVPECDVHHVRDAEPTGDQSVCRAATSMLGRFSMSRAGHGPSPRVLGSLSEHKPQNVPRRSPHPCPGPWCSESTYFVVAAQLVVGAAPLPVALASLRLVSFPAVSHGQ